MPTNKQAQTQLIIILILGGLGLWLLSRNCRKRKEGISFSGYGYRGQRCRAINPWLHECQPSPGPNRDWDLTSLDCQVCLLNNELCVNGEVSCEDCLEACSKWIG